MSDVLKLSTGIAPACAEFMAEFRSATTSNPMSMRSRLWMGEVAIDVQPFGSLIRLVEIRSVRRGRGSASKALDWLLSLARKHGVDLSCTAKPLGSDGLSLDALCAWYQRHGFRRDSFGDFRWSGRKPFGGPGLGQGRKPIVEGESSVVLTARVSRAQKAKFDALGGAAWLREAIEKAELTA